MPNVLDQLGVNFGVAIGKAVNQKTTAKRPAAKKVVATTKKAEIAKTAREALASKVKSGNILQAFGSGVNQWLPFEAVNRIVAGGADLVGYGDHDTVGWNQKNFEHNLDVLRAVDSANYEAHPWAYRTGAVSGVFGGGGLLTGGVKAGGNVLTKIPKLEKVGKAIVASQILNKGEKAKNILKLATTGAAVGGAEEAVRGGSGTDILKAAGVGSVAAPVAVGAAKAASYAARPVIDAAASVASKLGGYFSKPFAEFIQNKNAASILRRITGATGEEMEAARAAYKAKTNGAEPTLFEILPKADQDNIRKIVIRNSPAIQEQAADAIRTRAGNVEGEMLNSVDELTGIRRNSIAAAMQNDIARSKGAPVSAADRAMASDAMESTAGIAKLRRAESSNIMAPHDDKVAYQSVEELFPQRPVLLPNQNVKWEISDPEAAALIKGAAGSLRLSENITVDNLTKVLRNLKTKVARGNVDEDAAQRAINHIEDIFAEDHPEAAQALAEMNAAYAARSRMNEGFQEGGRTRSPDEFPVNNADDLRAYENVYGSPEGATGRTLGQIDALRSSFSGTPEAAIRAVGDLAGNSGTQRAVATNISPRVALNLSEAAGAQEAGLRSLSGLRGATKGDIDEAGIGALGDALLAFNPGSFPLTRFAAVARLAKLTKLGEKKAAFLVDHLFSQDAAKIKLGISLLDNAGAQGRRFLGEMIAGIAGGQHMGPGAIETDPVEEEAPAANAEPDYSKMSDEELMQQINGDQDYSKMSDEELMQQVNGTQDTGQGDQPYGRAVVEALFPGIVVTEDVRDPNSRLARENPDSWHLHGDGAVDVRPIPGMSFEEFIGTIKDQGYELVEAIDEVKHPSKHATGPHWHVVFA